MSPQDKAKNTRIAKLTKPSSFQDRQTKMRRDMFAAEAMRFQSWKIVFGEKETEEYLRNAAEDCYLIADAMIEASK
jgi:hypothetical protein